MDGIARQFGGATRQGDPALHHAMHMIGDPQRLAERGGWQPSVVFTRNALCALTSDQMGQLTTGSIPRISIHAEGAASELNIKPIAAAVLCGFLREQSDKGFNEAQWEEMRGILL